MTITRAPFFLYPGGSHPIKPWGERVDALYSPTASRSLGDGHFKKVGVIAEPEMTVTPLTP